MGVLFTQNAEAEVSAVVANKAAIEALGAQGTSHSSWPVMIEAFLTGATHPSCADGMELMDGQCQAVCRYGSADLFGASHDCRKLQFNLIGGFFVGGFSLVIWFYVILRMSVRRQRRMAAKADYNKK